MIVSSFDTRTCMLGEGPLWHPEREQLFWFDILAKKLLSRVGDRQLTWQFDEYVSAAGWIDKDRLLIASETQLFQFNLTDGTQTHVAHLEAELPNTRSNDGRADPWGGFWIGTMGKNAEPKAGSIYRFYNGEISKLFGEITISNSICFSPDKRWAYFTDTADGFIQRQALDDDGWPTGAPEILIDLSHESFGADGSVVDTEGYIWNAQWGASRVARYAPDGTFEGAIDFPALQVSCPAFGGPDRNMLYATSATQGMTVPGPKEGQTYLVQTEAVGQLEHRVKIW